MVVGIKTRLMEHLVKKVDVAASMSWAFIKPFVVIMGGLFMLVMLMLLCMEASMLAEYWSSERVYAASAEQPDPAREGCLVRVTGPLCANEPSAWETWGLTPE